VEVSTDNNNWTLVVDKTNNTSTAQTQRDSFTATASIITVHQFTGVILIMSDFEGIRAHLTAKRAWRGRGITIYDYHAPSPGYWNPCQSSGWRS